MTLARHALSGSRDLLLGGPRASHQTRAGHTALGINRRLLQDHALRRFTGVVLRHLGCQRHELCRFLAHVLCADIDYGSVIGGAKCDERLRAARAFVQRVGPSAGVKLAATLVAALFVAELGLEAGMVDGVLSAAGAGVLEHDGEHVSGFEDNLLVFAGCANGGSWEFGGCAGHCPS